MKLPSAHTILLYARQLFRDHWGLLLLLVVALAFRLAYLEWFKTFPPGDTFNFINVARSLPEGEYPINERRLPFYPLLILLTHPLFGWELAGMVIAVTMSLVALAAIYAVGRKLGFPKTALLGILLVFQAHPLVLTATRGYADTTLFALFPLTLLALLSARTWKGAVCTGVLAGAMALTRYEGLATAAVILPLWLLVPGNRPRRLPLIAAAACVITLIPYLLLAGANNRPPFGTGYIAEAETRDYGTDSPIELGKNILQIWRRNALFGAWDIPRAISREISEDPFATPRILASRLIEGGEIFTLLAFLGLLALLFRRQWSALLFLLAATAAATIPPAWFNPLVRYDLFVLPLTILLTASGAAVFQRLVERGTADSTNGRMVRWFVGGFFLFIAAGLWTMTQADSTRNRQLKHNGRDYAYYQAIHAARALDGNILFDRDPDIVRLYFGERAVIMQGLPPNESPATIAARLREKQIRYLVLPNPDTLKSFQPLLTSVEVLVVESFEWPQGNNDISRATIYQID